MGMCVVYFFIGYFLNGECLDVILIDLCDVLNLL